MHYMSFVAFAILQVLAVVHAVSRGLGLRYILMICLFPVAGPIAHFILEAIPFVQDFAQRVRLFKKRIAIKRLKPEAKLKALQQAALKTPNYENGYQLVLGLLAQGLEDQAYSELKQIRKGIFKDCPRLTMLQVKIELKLGLNLDAFASIKPLMQAANNLPEIDLLFAKVLEANHYHQAAIEAYRKLLNQHYSFETHFYYIRLLTMLEQKSEVKKEIMTLVSRYQSLNKTHQKIHKKWYALANQVH